MILLERVKWVGHTRLENMRNVYSISVTKTEMKKVVENLGVDGT
jgi:hypothetical protein